MTGRTACGLAAEVLSALWRGGVRDVVLAPGSRSAPLAMTLYAADLAGDVRLHVRVDERSAGFLALGLTMGSRRPVAVVTTSGTAVGNLVPAVMEAHHSGRAVVVVSADRPERMRRTGANQTTEQAGLFGVFAPCHDLSPESDPEVVAAAALSACHRVGPTHLNVQLDGDLMPPDPDPVTWWRRPAPADRDIDPATDRSVPREELAPGPRTVVVAGDDAGPAARLLAEASGWPLLAEPTSGARVGNHAIRTYRLLLGTSLGRRVERVVVVGHPTLSRPLTRLISDPALDVIAVRPRTGVATDPGRVARVVDAVPTAAGPDPDPGWLDAWLDTDRRLGAGIDEFVAAQRDSSGSPAPLAVAAVVAEAVTAHASLVVGSSNVVRDLDVMATPWEPHEHRFVVGNRGLSGIDGTVSTAIGVALGRPDASRTIAYLGDLTFLHDANGLLVGLDEPRADVTFVVLNDDGGAIFASLEQGANDFAPAFEKVFGTPHTTDLAALCAAHGAAYELVDDVSRLSAALDEEARGRRVLEVKASRAHRRAEAQHLRILARRIVDRS